MKSTGKERYASAPVEMKPLFFFTSKEKEKEFLKAPKEVRDYAMNLIEMCMKRSAKEIEMDFILNWLQKIDERLRILESK